MEIDFDGVGEVTDFVTVPAGTYLCRVADVRQGTTRTGDERWGLRLVVAEGQHVGRQAAWDSLVFSTRGRARAKLVFLALGMPARGRVKVEPDDLVGRTALVEVRPVEYPGPTGDVIRRNEVPYDGYRPVPGGGGGGKGGDRRKTAAGAGDDDGEPENGKDRPIAADDIPF